MIRHSHRPRMIAQIQRSSSLCPRHAIDSERIESQADRRVGHPLPHIRQQPFPWRRPTTVHSIHGGRGRGSTAQKRESRGAVVTVVKLEDESSPPDVTDTALVDVVGGLPKRLGAGEATASYRSSPRKCKEKLLQEAMTRTVAEAMEQNSEASQKQIHQREQKEPVASSSAVLHCDQTDLNHTVSETQVRMKFEEVEDMPVQGPTLEEEESLQCQAIAENCLKRLKEETLTSSQVPTSTEPVASEPQCAEEEASSTSWCDGQVSSSFPEDHGEFVENMDHAEIAVSSSSSSSGATNPEIQSLRQRIDECVAAQGPLREKANEMLRSLHHHRAMLKAARKEVEKSAKSAEVAAKVRQAQLLAELRHSHSQVWQVHAHCIAENIDLKEKLRASLERREKLLKEIQLVKMSPCFPQERCLKALSPPPGLERIESDEYTSSGETKTDSEESECQGVCKAPAPSAHFKSVKSPSIFPDEGGKDVLLMEQPEQPEPEPFKSPHVGPVEAVMPPILQSLPKPIASERKDSDAQDLTGLEVAPPPGLDTFQARGSGVEVNGRCWVAKANKSKVPGTKGFAKRRLSALSVGMEVEGEILHYSAGVGAFVNVGAAIDGFVNSLDMPAIKLKAGDLVSGLVVREIDLNAPRLLLSAANVMVHC
ncbi:unnamed protein product [Cladocopium goreaui]|uniref:S1 motif domain-containing protein n=1 Tax=Cladocopium goreaui TaxID=2562237 RepID=A0A9P1CD39_9DINO|nr:unnamed protein product [Cladocopium goreaui]